MLNVEQLDVAVAFQSHIQEVAVLIQGRVSLVLIDRLS